MQQTHCFNVGQGFREARVGEGGEVPLNLATCTFIVMKKKKFLYVELKSSEKYYRKMKDT